MLRLIRGRLKELFSDKRGHPNHPRRPSSGRERTQAQQSTSRAMSYEHASSDFQRIQVATLAERDRWKESLLETEGLLASTEIEAEALEVRAKDAEAREAALIKRVAKLELDQRVVQKRLAEHTEITKLFSAKNDREQVTHASQSQIA